MTQVALRSLSNQGAKMGFRRYFTKDGVHPFDSVKWKTVDAVITSPNGKEKFRQNGVEFPEFWSDRAIQIVSEKYFRVCNGVKEHSVKQMIGRVAGTIAKQAFEQGIFANEGYAKIFEEELIYVLLHQMYAFNSPVWFNIGVPGVKQQASACFIQLVEDSMESITNTVVKEMMLFKGGSGTGSNLSNLRSSYEGLSNGGTASGPVSFMEVFDKGAGVTKSGGGTRRAAKMVVLNVDHPDILEQKNGNPGFITCKAEAEKTAHALIDTGKFSGEFNVPGNAYELVGFQNANNSVRVTDDFMEAVVRGDKWHTRKVISDDVVHTYEAKELWKKIAEAAWFCGDPGIQFDTTTNKWHTCPNSGRINASNPCSEYLFLDDTACNLGSLNLMKFFDGKHFNAHALERASSLVITAMEVLVGFSSYPSESITKNSHDFRPLGLGYANLGALLMNMGLAYDSDEGREVAAAITALMSAGAYRQSAAIARAVGPFPEFDKNREEFLHVMRMHKDATENLPFKRTDDESFDDNSLDNLFYLARDTWHDCVFLGEQHGYRNSQISVIAPTGTISFLMDCDTTGIEPMAGLVLYKKLVGGGMMKMPNHAVKSALKSLGYAQHAIDDILKEIADTGEIPVNQLSPRHRKVFQTAIGQDSISVEGHLKMMAAVQPFLSGGISKTVNMPCTATVEDVADAYMQAWELGLKCVAIYRDGCKRSQPIATKMTDTSKKEVEAYTGLKWGQRKRLGDERRSLTHKYSVGGQEGYIHVGIYDDGSPGEIFMSAAKAGSTLHGIMDFAATAMSLGLQHGVPLATFIEKLKDSKFEPAGMTSNPQIRMAKSITDYLGRWLEHKFVKAPEEAPALEVAPPKPIGKPSFNGDPCRSCGNMTQRAGSCWVCTSCGTTTGCG